MKGYAVYSTVDNPDEWLKENGHFESGGLYWETRYASRRDKTPTPASRRDKTPTPTSPKRV